MKKRWKILAATLLLAPFALPPNAAAHPQARNDGHYRHEPLSNITPGRHGGHHRHWQNPRKYERPIRYRKPHYGFTSVELRLPRKHFTRGSVLILPDGRKGRIHDFGHRRLTLRIDGELFSFAYQFND